MFLRRFFFVILIVLFLNGCSNKISQEDINLSQKNSNGDDYSAIINVIEDYHEVSYDMWMSLKVGDLSEYLNLESIQCYNKVIAFKENIERWKYGLEKYHSKDFRERHVIFFKYNSIEIAEDTAVVKVNLSGETTGQPAYPFFVTLGKNTFILKKKYNNWLIHEHEYSNYYFYERSKTEKLKLNIEKIHEEVDRDYR